jgi:hypothetical protein
MAELDIAAIESIAEKIKISPFKSSKFYRFATISLQDGRPLVFATPVLRLPFGLFQSEFMESTSSRNGGRVGDNDNAVKITVPLALDDLSPLSETGQFAHALNTIDENIKRYFVKEATYLFGDAKEGKFLSNNIDTCLNGLIKQSIDEKYSPLISAKVIPETRFFDANNAQFTLQAAKEAFTKNDYARVRFKITGLTYMASSRKLYYKVDACVVKLCEKPSSEPATPMDDEMFKPFE